LVVPPDHVFDAIANASLGDLRQAISQLQMYMLGRSLSSTTASTSSGGDSSSDRHHDRHRGVREGGGRREGVVWVDPEAGSRDKSFSFLHGVAKLLGASVRTQQSVAQEEAAEAAAAALSSPSSSSLLSPSSTGPEGAKFSSLYKLKFPPDSVIRRFDLSLDMTMSFLQFNYPGIFERAESKHNRKGQSAATGRLDPTLPLPSYDFLERAERLSEMLSEADMLYTCQFSTNLPIDRAQSSSFPKG
jgi:hypothetical protein